MSDKTSNLREKIAKSQERIAKEQEKIKGWKQEIVAQENLEIQGLLKEHNLTVSELKEFLSSKPTEESYT